MEPERKVVHEAPIRAVWYEDGSGRLMVRMPDGEDRAVLSLVSPIEGITPGPYRSAQ